MRIELYRAIERIWWRDQPPPRPLQWLSRPYAAASRWQLGRRLAHQVSIDVPLISVGNITAGGSGKTPFTIWLAGKLRHHGFSPVIICRGDGGKAHEPIVVDAKSDPCVVGDEARLLFDASGCPVIAGRDRVRAANLAVGLGDIVILDDGFQYRQLARTCDIVLVPAAGVGNGHLIPAGPLREPLDTLDRADLIVRTGAPRPPKPLPCETTEWWWRTRPGALDDLMDCGRPLPQHVLAATGIARPERFLEDLRSKGFVIEMARLFPDHMHFSPTHVRQLLDSGLPVVVTEKDAVKLRLLWPGDQPLWVLHQMPVAQDGLIEAILEFIPGNRQQPGSESGR